MNYIKKHYFINDINLIEDKTVNIQKDIIVCFIGNYEIGTKLLNKIAKSSKNNLPIVLIFRNNEIYERTTKLVQLFKNRIVFISKEYGNDIIPTLQAINYMLSKYNIQNIYKFHTKSDEKWFNECTEKATLSAASAFAFGHGAQTKFNFLSFK